MQKQLIHYDKYNCSVSKRKVTVFPQTIVISLDVSEAKINANLRTDTTGIFEMQSLKKNNIVSTVWGQDEVEFATS